MSRMFLTGVLVLLAGAAASQERPASEPSKGSRARRDAPAATREATAIDRSEPEKPRVPRPAIRVLRDPYDLASYYRAGGSSPWAGLASDPSYSIAAAYRGETSPYGWSRFWTNGYGAQRPAPLVPYRRTIGQNGDIFLLVPFLAPVGPISGAFAGY